MADLTPKQWKEKMQRFLREVARGKFVEQAARDVMTVTDQRIFSQGKKTSGGKIGSYSLKPIYISPDAAPRAVRNVGKTGKRIKSGYYAGGYKQFRQQQGREAGFVNLRLSGEMRNDMANSTGAPKPEKLTPLSYRVTISKPVNIAKRKGLEKKYGTVFDLTRQEDQRFHQLAAFYYGEVQARHFGTGGRR